MTISVIRTAARPVKPLTDSVTDELHERVYLFLQQAELARHALHSNAGLLQLFMDSSRQVVVPVS